MAGKPGFPLRRLWRPRTRPADRDAPAASPVPPPPPAPSAHAAPAPPAPAADPVATLIATSERHYEAGRRELSEGHLDQARREFDRSVSILLESSDGARSDARLRDHFDRLVDRISAQESAALAEGDGFSEGPSEPAPPGRTPSGGARPSRPRSTSCWRLPPPSLPRARRPPRPPRRSAPTRRC